MFSEYIKLSSLTDTVTFCRFHSLVPIPYLGEQLLCMLILMILAEVRVYIICLHSVCIIRGIDMILAELCVRHHCPKSLSQLDAKKTEYENLWKSLPTQLCFFCCNFVGWSEVFIIIEEWINLYLKDFEFVMDKDSKKL